MASAWSWYYPLTSAVPTVIDDLRALDLWAEGGDGFPGQRQLLAAWDDAHPLPGARPELGVFALQQDWLSTYVGGVGLYSATDGLQDAIDAGGDLIARLAEAPLDGAVEVSVLAGRNPMIPVDRAAIDPDVLGAQLPDFLGLQRAAYRDLIEGPMAGDFPDLQVTDAELDALSTGEMLLGEITGLSDGLVFAASALDTEGLLAGGATLAEVYVADLSHLDLLFASVPVGEALIAQGPPHGAALGARYVAADTLGWIAAQLERGEAAGDDDDSATPGDDDDSAAPGDDDDDSAAPGDDDDDSAAGAVPWTGCACTEGPAGAPAPPMLLLLLLLFIRRR